MTLEFEEFNKNLLASAGKSIFDVGCGTGRYYEWAQKWGFSYVGVDIDPEVIKKAILKYRTTANFNPDIFNVLTESGLSAFPDKSCDTILMVEVIEHVKDLSTLEELFRQCFRIARKNIMLTTPNCSDEDLLRQHGLIYVHYTHSVGQGYNFKMDTSHNHHLRFTKKSLSEFLTKFTPNFTVVERKPISILHPTCYYKLWAEIQI